MVDPVSAMTALTGALSLLRQAAGLAKDVKAVELQGKLLELQEKLGDAQVAFNQQTIANMRLIDELRAAKDALRSAEDRLKAKGERRQHGNAVWIRGNRNPLCIVCEARGTDIPMHFDETTGFTCGGCGKYAGQCQPPQDWGIQPFGWPPPLQQGVQDYDPFR